MVARNKVVLTGTLGSPALEEVQVGWAFDGPAGETVSGSAALNTWAAGIAAVLDAGETDYANLTSMMGSNCAFNRVRVYHYADTGPATAVGESTFAWSGTGTATQPLTASSVFSLLTERAGASYRGRTYWPHLTAAIQPSGLAFLVSGALTDFVEMLGDICDASPVPNMRPVVYSPTRNVVTPVTRLRYGNVLDVQRRRSEGLNETFSTLAYTNP